MRWSPTARLSCVRWRPTGTGWRAPRPRRRRAARGCRASSFLAVTVELSDTKIRFTIGGVVLTSKLIDGTFPDYQRVIPTGNDKKLTIDRQTFAAAVDRVSTISSERGRAVKLAIADGQVTLTVNNPDSGSATEEVAADYGSDPIEIGFNAKYLLDVSAQLTGSEACFMLADAGSPTLIQDASDSQALYVLMPMRV